MKCMVRLLLSLAILKFEGTCGFSAPPPLVRSWHTHSPASNEQVHVRSECLASCHRMARTSEDVMSQNWLPSDRVDDDNIFAVDEERDELERRSICFLAELIRRQLSESCDTTPSTNETEGTTIGGNEKAYQIAKGRFLDLTCTIEGEQALEKIFSTDVDEEEDVIRGAIIALQSLLVMGTQVGVKGSPNQLKKMVSHLQGPRRAKSDKNIWDRDCIRKLKHELDMTPGMQLLAELKRKRTAQGAFDLLVDLGAFDVHEDLALLRSGFPTRFTEAEENAAKEALLSTRDPDTSVGLRKDFRAMKVYTIDSEFTADIDDGLSVEVLTNDDGSAKNRFWIHIADADRWAPRNSDLFKAARRRATSLYLPTGPVAMFPESVGNGVMSLRQGCDCCAISLGVELMPDGSIDPSSIIVTPSLVQVSYRLTYDEVDEMLEEGVGYSEEWQLGAMLAVATRRRAFRIAKGSSEGIVTTPMPQGSITVLPDEESEGGVSISVEVEVTHNAGANQTSIAETSSLGNSHAAPVSQAFLLVTEMMILAGEAIGKWKTQITADENASTNAILRLENNLELPYRGQPEPDFKSRESEVKVLEALKASNNDYPHAWYFRRFFKPVRVTEDYRSHFGLGLDCYVQWTSPIRRFGDLQAHAAVKRYLRRKRVNELMHDGEPIPADLSSVDLGCEVPVAKEAGEDGRITKYALESEGGECDPIDYKVGLALGGAARFLQRKSREYWMFEYIKRMVTNSPEEVSFECVVLGCINPERLQYAIYVKELGFEHRYLSEMGNLKVGQTLWLKVASVYPRTGLLTLSLASRASGMASAAAAA